ncbi:hypothetical protein MN608_07124 [Microdochium nivale]|nr:hypothetical protein MN608_07124 [Microdochium nivale]
MSSEFSGRRIIGSEGMASSRRHSASQPMRHDGRSAVTILKEPWRQLQKQYKPCPPERTRRLWRCRRICIDKSTIVPPFTAAPPEAQLGLCGSLRDKQIPMPATRQQLFLSLHVTQYNLQ